MKFCGGNSSFHLQMILVIAVICLIVYVLYVSKDIVALEKQAQLHRQQLDDHAKHIAFLLNSSTSGASISARVSVPPPSLEIKKGRGGSADVADAAEEDAFDIVSIVGSLPEVVAVHDEDIVAVHDEDIVVVKDADEDEPVLVADDDDGDEDAVKIDEEEKEVPADENTPRISDEKNKVQKMSWAELKMYSKELGLSSRNMNKEQLMDRVLQHITNA
jgi:hypothetical protein